ncbi:MAG: polysaccharide deacetylase family protein [bacterium]|nr:polysaccharide deacetylase family protein [bacterium]
MSIKTIIKETIFKTLYYTRTYALAKPLYSGIGSILMFHRVIPQSGEPSLGVNEFLEVTPEYLEECILFFKKNKYDIISPNQLAERFNNPKKFVIFTFDDGYKDNLIHALPVFQKHQAPLTVYITTHFPDFKAVLWWYILEDLILRQESLSFELEGKPYSFDSSWEKAKISTYYAILDIILNTMDITGKETLFNSLFGPYSIDLLQKTRDLALSWDQVKELSNDPLVTLGAHTMSHPNLRLLSPDDLTREISGSVELLESRTGTAIKHFAYPFGTSNEAGEREFTRVKDLGFTTATTTRQANIFPVHASHLEALPRIPVYGGPPASNINLLKLWTSGMAPALMNKFKRKIIV